MSDDPTEKRVAAILESVPEPPGVTTSRVGPLGLPFPVPSLGPEANRDQPRDGTPPDDASESPPDRRETAGSATLDEAVEYGENYIDRVEEAVEDEDCSICRSILRSLRGEDIETQVKGVRELAELKRRVDAGADADELVEVMDTFDVIGEVDQYL